METKLEYLYKVYECDDIETLKYRCPICLDYINLNDTATVYFKDMVQTIKEKENEDSFAIVMQRDLEEEKEEDIPYEFWKFGFVIGMLFYIVEVCLHWNTLSEYSFIQLVFTGFVLSFVSSMIYTLLGFIVEFVKEFKK